eukprot:scaffold4248_cov107-Skeletonema_marinoi.AAC.10
MRLRKSVTNCSGLFSPNRMHLSQSHINGGILTSDIRFSRHLPSPEASQRSKRYVGFSIRIIAEDGIRMPSFSFLQS